MLPIITKLEILDHLERITVCTGYKDADGLAVPDISATSDALAKVVPVHKALPGWRSDTSKATTWSELPAKARDYLDFLEDRTGVEIGCVSVGPERTQTITKPGSNFERMS